MIVTAMPRSTAASRVGFKWLSRFLLKNGADMEMDFKAVSRSFANSG